MSVSGILSSAVFGIGTQIFQSRKQQVQKEFQQLGQDLQSGNLSAAQSDFAVLQKLQPQPAASSSSQGSSSIKQDFNQLAADLNAGNTTAAQQDFARLQKDIRTQPPTTRDHHAHHDGSAGGANSAAQLFGQLGQALQSGSLSAAQQAYTAMLQNFQQYAQTNGLPTLSSSTGISVSA